MCISSYWLLFVVYILHCISIHFIIHRSVQLFLEPNDRLISEDFVWQIRDDSESVTYEEKSPRRCHYMHRISRTGDGGVTAAFTYCPGSSKVSC